jgi:hypothetical protein
MVSFEEDRVYPAVTSIAPIDPWHKDIALVDPNRLTSDAAAKTKHASHLSDACECLLFVPRAIW